MKCPGCGAESAGNFCAQCGASLQSSVCAGCGAALLPGARFCTYCGTRSGTKPAPTVQSGSSLPWYIAGGALLLIALILLLPMLRRDPVADVPASQLGGGAPGPLIGTPREQADRLYDRIMREREAGDTAQAKFFVPMALQAYQNAAPLDHDGLFHLAAIQVVGGDFAGARSTADRILADNPNHLLALAVAAEAATRAGDTAEARELYQRFLDAYDTETAKTLQEYQDHARMLPEYQRIARETVGA